MSIYHTKEDAIAELHFRLDLLVRMRVRGCAMALAAVTTDVEMPRALRER